MASVKLEKIVEKMKLENLTPELDISKIKIKQPDINRPALQMAGYFEHFEDTRLQIIGFVEYTYMEGLPQARQKEVFTRLLSYDIPAIIFSRELQPNPLFFGDRTGTQDSAFFHEKGNLFLYGRDYPLAECDAGALYFRARCSGGCLR